MGDVQEESNAEFEKLLTTFMYEQAFKTGNNNDNREIHYMGPECAKAMKQVLSDSKFNKEKNNGKS